MQNTVCLAIPSITPEDIAPDTPIGVKKDGAPTPKDGRKESSPSPSVHSSSINIRAPLETEKNPDLSHRNEHITPPLTSITILAFMRTLSLNQKEIYPKKSMPQTPAPSISLPSLPKVKAAPIMEIEESEEQFVAHTQSELTPKDGLKESTSSPGFSVHFPSISIKTPQSNRISPEKTISQQPAISITPPPLQNIVATGPIKEAKDLTQPKTHCCSIQ